MNVYVQSNDPAGNPGAKVGEGTMVEVWSRGDRGEAYRISFLKTGPDSGYLEVVSWSAGQNPHSSRPAKTEGYALYGIRMGPNGRISCKAAYQGLDPDVICEPDHGPPTQVVIEARQFLVVLYRQAFPLSPEDFAALLAFLNGARFP